MKYMVDIDGTICTTHKNEDGSNNYELAQPIKHRIAKLNKLFDEGHEVHYYTARGSGSGKDWWHFTYIQLLKWGCKLSGFSTGKPSYDVFICDKAVNAEKFFN